MVPNQMFIGWLLVAAAPAVAADAESVEVLVQAALAAHPDLAALEATEQTLRERAAVAGAWPDPMVSVEYSNAPLSTFNISDHPMGGVQFRASQTFRPMAWSRLSRALVGLQADQVEARRGEAALRLEAAVTQTWWVLARTAWLERVTETHIARVRDLLEAVRARYEVGSMGQHGVLRLEVLRDRLTDDLGEFTRQRRELVAQLVRAHAIPEGEQPTLPVQAGVVRVPSQEDWEALAVAHRPAVQGLDAQIQQAQAGGQLAKSDLAPDVNVWAGYRLRTGDAAADGGVDLFSFGVGVPIPAGSARRARGDVAAWGQAAREAASMRQALLEQVTADAEGILARWERAQDKAETYAEALIPRAEAVLTSALADFRVGRTDFASLFEAEVALLDLERARITAATETHLQHAELAMVLGVAFPGVP